MDMEIDQTKYDTSIELHPFTRKMCSELIHSYRVVLKAFGKTWTMDTITETDDGKGFYSNRYEDKFYDFKAYFNYMMLHK